MTPEKKIGPYTVIREALESARAWMKPRTLASSYAYIDEALSALTELDAAGSSSGGKELSEVDLENRAVEWMAEPQNERYCYLGAERGLAKFALHILRSSDVVPSDTGGEGDEGDAAAPPVLSGVPSPETGGPPDGALQAPIAPAHEADILWDDTFVQLLAGRAGPIITDAIKVGRLTTGDYEFKIGAFVSAIISAVQMTGNDIWYHRSHQ